MGGHTSERASPKYRVLIQRRAPDPCGCLRGCFRSQPRLAAVRALKLRPCEVKGGRREERRAGRASQRRRRRISLTPRERSGRAGIRGRRAAADCGKMKSGIKKQASASKRSKMKWLANKREGRAEEGCCSRGSRGIGQRGISSPPSPALYGSSVPAESSFSRGPGLRSSRGTDAKLGGRGRHQIWAARLNTGRASGCSLAESSRCVIVLQTARQIRVSACWAARAVKNEVWRSKRIKATPARDQSGPRRYTGTWHSSHTCCRHFRPSHPRFIRTFRARARSAFHPEPDNKPPTRGINGPHAE